MIDPKMYLLVIYFVGAVLILTVVGIISITIWSDDSIPDILQNLASGALAGLIGMLVQRGK